MVWGFFGEGDVAYFNMYGVAYAIIYLAEKSTDYHEFEITHRESEKPIFYATVGKNPDIKNMSAFFSMAQDMFRQSDAPLKKSW
jgi:hypothetical protein